MFKYGRLISRKGGDAMEVYQAFIPGSFPF